ncbi:hypothetical protein BpHYR1_019401 [Brachionus plicatilis]|uniref:HAT C-terminal dimerisation domain-containing protein n=1 Tax=Brachionus plicatilis TaxID=10195 RepID=A0A3M7SPA6_BRAPC|nr:hypothetical protein BpHYR1_019401 [Brachionus plicatilis]
MCNKIEVHQELTRFKKCLYLYILVLKYLSIPASSGPIERTFTYAGYINRPQRSRMTLSLITNSRLRKRKNNDNSLNDAETISYENPTNLIINLEKGRPKLAGNWFSLK